MNGKATEEAKMDGTIPSRKENITKRRKVISRDENFTSTLWIPRIPSIRVLKYSHNLEGIVVEAADGIVVEATTEAWTTTGILVEAESQPEAKPPPAATKLFAGQTFF
nr:hypothetical protein Iba_chr12cCG13170 [Ipomoea batatas]